MLSLESMWKISLLSREKEPFEQLIGESVRSIVAFQADGNFLYWNEKNHSNFFRKVIVFPTFTGFVPFRHKNRMSPWHCIINTALPFFNIDVPRFLMRNGCCIAPHQSGKELQVGKLGVICFFVSQFLLTLPLLLAPSTAFMAVSFLENIWCPFLSSLPLQTMHDSLSMTC